MRTIRNLSAKAIDGTIADEEFAELMQLSKAKRKTQEDRTALVTEFKVTIEEHRISIHDLFSASEINAAAAPSRRTYVGNKSKKFNFKDGPELIVVEKPGRPGFTCRYCKGQRLPAYVPKTLKELDNGQLESNLVNYYTATGQEYFSTVDGSIELAQLINYIKTHQMKPHLR